MEHSPVAPAWRQRSLLPLAVLGPAVLLLLPGRALAYDPTSWQLWGNELLHGRLNTAGGGPAWKPLPVLADALFSVFGHQGAVVAWLIVARAGAVAAVWIAFVIGKRLSGTASGVGMAAVTAVLVWIADGSLVATGMSEPLCAALVLAAVSSAQEARAPRAIGYLVGASLLRPEAWVALALASVWWVRSSRDRRRTGFGSAVLVLGVAAAWFVPDLLASGNLLRSVNRAAKPTSGGPLLTKTPVTSLVAETIHGVGVTLLCVAAAATAIAFAQRQKLPLLLVAVGLGWIGVDVALVALRAASGDSRYLLPGLVVLTLPAGLLPSQLLTSLRLKAATAAMVPITLAAMLLSTSSWRYVKPGLPGWRWQSQQSQADTALSQLLVRPVRSFLLRCRVVGTGPYEVPLVAWALDITFQRVHASVSDGAPMLVLNSSRVRPGADYRTQDSSGDSQSGWKLMVDSSDPSCQSATGTNARAANRPRSHATGPGRPRTG